MSSEQELKLEGDHKFWHRHGDGNLWKHEFYQNGELEGKRRVWNYNRDLWILSSYRNGKLEGEFKWCTPFSLHKYFRKDELIDSSFDFQKKHHIIK